MKFRRDQDIYISSNIEINCTQSLLITTQWTIHNHSNPTELLRLIDTSQNDLFIPSQTLSYGLYQIELIVTMTDFPSLSSSSSIYIEITRSTININLISYDALMITHDFGEDLVLNPGQYSFDLNRISFHKDVCDHIWKYFHSIFEYFRIGFIGIIVEFMEQIVRNYLKTQNKIVFSINQVEILLYILKMIKSLRSFMEI